MLEAVGSALDRGEPQCLQFRSGSHQCAPPPFACCAPPPLAPLIVLPRCSRAASGQGNRTRRHHGPLSCDRRATGVRKGTLPSTTHTHTHMVHSRSGMRPGLSVGPERLQGEEGLTAVVADVDAVLWGDSPPIGPGDRLRAVSGTPLECLTHDEVRSREANEPRRHSCAPVQVVELLSSPNGKQFRFEKLLST